MLRLAMMAVRCFAESTGGDGPLHGDDSIHAALGWWFCERDFSRLHSALMFSSPTADPASFLMTLQVLNINGCAMIRITDLARWRTAFAERSALATGSSSSPAASGIIRRIRERVDAGGVAKRQDEMQYPRTLPVLWSIA